MCRRGAAGARRAPPRVALPAPGQPLRAGPYAGLEARHRHCPEALRRLCQRHDGQSRLVGVQLRGAGHLHELRPCGSARPPGRRLGLAPTSYAHDGHRVQSRLLVQPQLGHPLAGDAGASSLHCRAEAARQRGPGRRSASRGRRSTSGRDRRRRGSEPTPRRASCSRSPTTTMYGSLATSASWIFLPTEPERPSALHRTPAARQRPATSEAYSRCRSETGRTTAWVGASQTGKRPGVVLDQDADEALHRAEQRPVDDHRRVLGVVGALIGEIESVRASGSRAGRCRTATSGRAHR